eukprot:6182089-Pleurochrysis_carterae.AAC.1
MRLQPGRRVPSPSINALCFAQSHGINCLTRHIFQTKVYACCNAHPSLDAQRPVERGSAESFKLRVSSFPGLRAASFAG